MHKNKQKYYVYEVRNGEWVYRDGDIIGIDRRTFERHGPDTYRIRNRETSETLPQVFDTKQAAEDFIKTELVEKDVNAMSDLKSKLMPPKPVLPPKVSNPVTDYHEGFNDGLRAAQAAINIWYKTDLEPLFANAVEVYGTTSYRSWDNVYLPEADTHRALLIGIEPIEQAVGIAEVRDALVDFTNGMSLIDKSSPEKQMIERLFSIAERIEKYGVKS